MSDSTLDRDTRRLLLLSAAIAHLLREQGADSGEPSAQAWVRTGHSGLGESWSWNPRSHSSWRMAGRLGHHRRP